MSVHHKDAPMVQKDVIIIGAGASGLLCAAECAKRGRSVLVFDHGQRACAKVLVSGGGRCNFTNLNVTAEHYLSDNPHFCKSALARFTPGDMLSLVRKHGIPYFEKEAGQLFCAKTSRDITAMLLDECNRAGVEMLFSCRVVEIAKDDGFLVTTDHGVFRSPSLVIATGGLSYPKLGASGFGHAVARQFGLRVTELRPALVPLLFGPSDRKLFCDLAGVSLEAIVSCGGKEFRGSILFTHRGVSGPAVLQASTYWQRKAVLLIDLLPGTDILAVFMAERQGAVTMTNLLARYLPRRFAQTWCELQGIFKPLNQYSDKELRLIAEGLHSWEVRPSATEGYGTAEVTAGGVDTGELSSKTMETKKVPGLYFIGEVVDVTGQLGGYNLHWAWASGHAAGQYA